MVRAARPLLLALRNRHETRTTRILPPLSPPHRTTSTLTWRSVTMLVMDDTAVADDLLVSPSPADDVALLTRLRELVLGGEYGPGTSLSEVKLAQYFDVSRTPVREALKQLQIEGLVEIRPKVGTFVRQITRREIVEMFEMKETMEGMAARLMARRGRIPELDILEANLETSEQVVNGTDSTRYSDLVHEFHETIVNGSDNNK